MGVKSVRRTQEEFIRDVKNAVGDEYTVIGKYINTDTKVSIKHNICGNLFDVRPYLFLGKISTRCPHCYGNKKRTTEEFSEIVKNLTGDEYTVLGTYKNTDTSILIRHNICKKEFNMRPACFKRGQRCPNCERSLGAEKIKKYLDNNSIKYRTEESFLDLFDKRKLKFDFYLVDYDVLIEYDGEQHFRVKSFGAGIEKSLKEFETIQRHDLMKNKYCMDKNKLLLRIPYWKYNNIEDILEKFIELLKVKESNTIVLNEFVSDVFSKNSKNKHH